MAEKIDERPGRVEDVRGSGIYPGGGPLPAGPAQLRSPAALAHPELRQRVPPPRPALEAAAQVGGRAIFGGYFLYNGLNHFLNLKMMSQYAGSKGVPLPGLAVVGSGLLILAGGASLVTGFRPKTGAGLITTFLLGVTPQMHAFWKEEDPGARMSEMVNFTKNMALVGAALLAAAHPEPWPWQVAPPRGGALVPSPGQG
jgi:putative oxidoreductase